MLAFLQPWTPSMSLTVARDGHELRMPLHEDTGSWLEAALHVQDWQRSPC